MSNLIDRDKLIEAHYDACNNDPNKAFYTWSLELMKNAPAENEWVSVSERLPEEENRYLVCVFNNETNSLEGYGVEPYYQDMNGNLIWGLENIKGQPFKVVAWKPIEPYTESEGE